MGWRVAVALAAAQRPGLRRLGAACGNVRSVSKSPPEANATLKWLLGKMTSSFEFTFMLLFLQVPKVTVKVLCLNSPL